MSTRISLSVEETAKWIPASFSLDDEFNCLTNAENLADANKHLRFTVGYARISERGTWGEHAWCVTPTGEIIDPYFEARFPKVYREIEYREDPSSFDGMFE